MKTRKASIARVDKEKCLDSLQDVKTVYRYSPISIFGFYETLSYTYSIYMYTFEMCHLKG